MPSGHDVDSVRAIGDCVETVKNQNGTRDDNELQHILDSVQPAQEPFASAVRLQIQSAIERHFASSRCRRREFQNGTQRNDVQEDTNRGRRRGDS